MNAAREHLLRDLAMRWRGHDDRDCIHDVEQLLERSERPDAQLARYLLRAIGTRIEEAGERRPLHVAEDANVMDAQPAGAHHADAHGRAQTTTPRPLSSTKR